MIVQEGRFVHRSTEAEVLDDFRRFCERSSETLVSRHDMWVARGTAAGKLPLLFRTHKVGQKLSEHFHWKHRVRTRTKWLPCAQEVLDRWNNDPSYLDRAMERVKRISLHRMDEETLRFHVVRVNSSLMTVTHFRAGVSRFLCDEFRPVDVLDFSAGWGDRLTGFLAASSVQRIVLIDPRPGCIRACEGQHSLVRSDKVLEAHCAGAEVVMPGLPAESVDLVVSSPPYFDAEHYGDTPEEQVGQVRFMVSNTTEYLDAFLFPVLHQCARVLRKGGILCLNIDDHPQLKLCDATLAHVAGTFHLIGTAGLRKGNGFGKGLASAGGRSKAEPVYLFRRL